jgi:uncharacterized repeat protein (TIGR03806 family)
MIRATGALLAALLAVAPALAAVDHAALVSDTPPRTLSATGLFSDPARHVLADGVAPYSIAAPLWSDGADKRRAIAMPPGASAQVTGDGLLDLPVGTVLMKTFGYADTGALETRLLVRRAAGWVALPYVWNAARTDADLKRAGATLPVAAHGGRPALDWQVPNVNQCKSCHSVSGVLQPIGVKARNLAATGDLARWRNAGLLTGAAPGAIVPLLDDARAPLSARARGWLDSNCGHCHQRQGSASNSGLFLDWEEKDPVALGIGKRPVAAGRGSGGRAVAIAPGHPEASILLYRIESGEPGVMMPELGRVLPDAQGIALIRQWIAELQAP